MLGNGWVYVLEKRFKAVPPQLFTTDGTTRGGITIAANACSLFKVKQKVILSATGLPNLELEIKQIAGNIQVGPISHGKPGVNTSIDARTDISAYTVAAGAFIFANEQKRPSIDNIEIVRATYEEEPTVAVRSIMVDPCGDLVSATNPLPVTVEGGALTSDVNIHDANGNPFTSANPLPVVIEDANLNVTLGAVRITACDNDPVAGDIHSSVRISNCANDLMINPDGSINVNIGASTATPGLLLYHNDITSVASGIETTIITVTAPGSGLRLEKIDVSGENVALYRVYINGTKIYDKRSWWTAFNVSFEFENFDNGYILTAGQVLTVTCYHTRPYLANFEATVLALAT